MSLRFRVESLYSMLQYRQQSLGIRVVIKVMSNKLDLFLYIVDLSSVDLLAYFDFTDILEWLQWSYKH